MPRPVLNYEPREILRGDIPRTVGSLVGIIALFACLAALAVWVSAGETRGTKVAAWLACVGFGALASLCMVIISRYSMAEIHDGKINFYFCGLRTRSIPLDADTTFELQKVVGRLEVLVISRGASRYVPNEWLNRQKLMSLLRTHGIAEAKMENAKASYLPDE